MPILHNLMKSASRKFKIGLFLGAIVTGCIVFFVFVGVRMVGKKQEQGTTSITSGANMSIDNVHQTATRDGVKEWSLEARSAKLMDSGEKALFTNVSVVFYLEDKSQVMMTAKEGVLNTATNDLTVTGNVVIDNSSYTMRTEKLHYKNNSRIVTVDEFVKISGKTMAFNADALTFDMNKRKIFMKGNVRGSINGRFYDI